MHSKIGRNDPCPCGSGRKYKQCCLGKPVAGRAAGAAADFSAEAMYRKYKVRLKTPEQIEGIRRCGVLVMQTFDAVRNLIRPGVKTEEINTVVHDFTVQHGARPAPLNYHGFPKSVCVSPNEVICHGIPGDYVLKDGDIVNVDITSVLDGYYADCNQTFFVGTPSRDARKIVEVTRESLRIGLEQARPGNVINDISSAIQKYAEGQGCSVVREYMGHGVGLDFHEAPNVPHYNSNWGNTPIVPGMTFTVEPMINLGRKEVRVLEDGWTAVTRDGSLSAQFEQTLVITEDGFESLTPFDL
ncbi:type I methionyl aminopeptidase [Pseudodesulfovibrio senegalensis]|uniref:Methionine aminopeptidase n=1 Tax=Pseudodesulfovibrio senegalensis TaxID=1721087 RepID=A0A6N6N189_9BACT|nr:type I methionyl aminopeptidase [Pseudodesulfovibrio senegalensis]KAB1441280.1 type I methionyl aminopeptidase [Pseudodesulfovibrio senegalensis]